MAGLLNKATGHAQSAIGSVTGNERMKAEGDAKVMEGQVKSEMKHGHHTTGAGMTANDDGGFAAQDSDRTKGSIKQSVGSAQQSVGSALGADGMQRGGLQRQAEGHAQENHGRAADLTSGLGEQISSNAQWAGAKLTGDKVTEAEMAKKAADGKARTQGVTDSV